MKILSIETSCDETAIAIVEGSGRGKNPKFKEVSSKVLSQVEIHKEYGGVFPSLAKREHGRNLVPVLLSVLERGYGNSKNQETRDKQTPNSKLQILNSKTQKKIEKNLEREPELLKQFLEIIPKIEKPKIDRIAVTYGPGLEPALWVGINFAKALSEVWNLPIIPVNHMEGHIASVLPLQNRRSSEKQDMENKDWIRFPAVALLISGGHTELVLVKKWGDYKVIGKTLDDAVGEAYDKVARMLGLPYPGGPAISQLAEKLRLQETKYGKQRKPENQKKNSKLEIKFPRPMINSEDLNFSFSGLKTSVLYFLKEKRKTSKLKKEVAKEFEESVAEVLITKTKKAIKENKAETLIIAGGVSANHFLRNSFKKELGKGVKILIPPSKLSTDNAVMIAMAGYLESRKNKKFLRKEKIVARGNLSL